MFFRKKETASPIDYLIVGLGNPGRQYENTRHNVGFLCADLLAQQLGVKLNKIKFKSLLGEARIGAKRCIILKPQTFMNNSGEAVREAAAFYKIPAEKIIVVFDDISLAPGQLRIRRKGSDGGHNGIKSILYHIGSDSFPRVKIGVGAKPHPDYDLAKWVLSTFTADEKKAVSTAVESAAAAVLLIVNGDIDKAMNSYNS